MSNGIDWKTIGDDTFEGIVDVLLSREFRGRGQPLDGRGGEGEIPGDFSVDDGKIIFEYKYFPEGFPTSNKSRRKQITRSFNQQKRRNPEQWILVFPAKLTPWEMTFLQKLGSGTDIAVNYRDKVWLDDQLAANPHLANYFRHYSDNDYLMEKAQHFKNFPTVARPKDLASTLALLMDTIEDADPNWGWDISTNQGAIQQTLIAKHPNAAKLSPVQLSFRGAFEAGSQTALDLLQSDAYGFSKPITIPGHLVRDFTITGPPLVAFQGEVDELQIGPESAGKWFDIELDLESSADGLVSSFPGKAQGVARGSAGWTFRVRLEPLVELTFRAPYTSGESGSADFTLQDFTGARPSDVADAADFVRQLHQADELHLRGPEGHLAAMTLAGGFNIDDRLQDYLDIWQIADDLVQIERATGKRFRYPATLSVEDRIMIRNLRLMFEGHCVAHPTWNQFVAPVDGNEAIAEQYLDTEYHWIIYTADVIKITILGTQIPLKQLHFAGVVAVDQNEADDLRAAIAAGLGAGRKLTMAGRPDDRIRMFLKDRYAENRPIGELTPWGIDGINQKGLTPEGQSLFEEQSDTP